MDGRKRHPLDAAAGTAGGEITMDAVEFLKEYKRMCGQIACESCPLYSNGGCDVLIRFPKSLDLRECVEAVEQWAKEYPVKTRRSEFLRIYPNAKMLDGEVIAISPCILDVQLRKDCKGDCNRCLRDYWLWEVE